MPVTRKDWVIYWAVMIMAPLIGWVMFRRDGAITFGIMSALAVISRLWTLMKRQS